MSVTLRDVEQSVMPGDRFRCEFCDDRHEYRDRGQHRVHSSDTACPSCGSRYATRIEQAPVHAHEHPLSSHSSTVDERVGGDAGLLSRARAIAGAPYRHICGLGRVQLYARTAQIAMLDSLLALLATWTGHLALARSLLVLGILLLALAILHVIYTDARRFLG